MVLAFEKEDFYELEQIELGIMPPIEEQQKYFSAFSKRVTDVMKEATRHQQPLSIAEAEQVVWKQIETELLQLPPLEEL
jgi:hypothetical protein